MSNAPVFNIDPADFWADPYPALAEMRSLGPLVYVPQFDRTMFVKREEIVKAEPNIAVFSSEQPEGLMNKLLGQNVMRRDGDAHKVERKALFPSVSPKAAREHWTAIFQTEAEAILAELVPKRSANLFVEYATRLSAQCLIKITGLETATWQQMDVWSQAMIDGIANYTDDMEVEARCNAATAAVDKAIDAMLPKVGNNSLDMINVMLAAGLPEESIRANIKLMITGGQNEPRDVIAGAIWALLTHPEQLAMVRAGGIGWMQVFEEFVRWLSPIGMSPRIITQEHGIGNVTLEAGDNIFFMLGSANRDEAYFDNADQFDITRDASKHIAFGAGPHFCAGAWISKAMVADIALPMLFEAMPNLHIVDDVRVGGWAFRGVLNLPCAW
ncbi:MAG: cytochrome P450 [Rhodobacteraceae bacterium]|nr:cytochrome P450 [Paracoccaceae bacterium]